MQIEMFILFNITIGKSAEGGDDPKILNEAGRWEWQSMVRFMVLVRAYFLKQQKIFFNIKI